MCRYCEKQKVFTTFPSTECECVVSEKKAFDILNDVFCRLHGSMPKGVSTTSQLLKFLGESGSILQDEMIRGRDKDIIDVVSNAVKYIFGPGDIGKWEYLDIGCGTHKPTLEISKMLCVYPWGVDYKDRRTEDTGPYYNIITKDKPLSVGESQLRLVTLCDVVHHVPNPEDVLANVAKIVCVGGFILISDHDCESWEDAYYFDLLHMVQSKCMPNGKYLPVHGYQKRSYVREILERLGFRPVYENAVGVYKSYVDVYKKMRGL